MPKKERRTFTAEFKHQIVQLYQNGKPRKDIIREYDLTPSSLDKWVNQSQHWFVQGKRQFVPRRKGTDPATETK